MLIIKRKSHFLILSHEMNQLCQMLSVICAFGNFSLAFMPTLRWACPRESPSPNIKTSHFYSHPRYHTLILSYIKLQRYSALFCFSNRLNIYIVRFNISNLNDVEYPKRQFGVSLVLVYMRIQLNHLFKSCSSSSLISLYTFFLFYITLLIVYTTLYSYI